MLKFGIRVAFFVSLVVLIMACVSVTASTNRPDPTTSVSVLCNNDSYSVGNHPERTLTADMRDEWCN